MQYAYVAARYIFPLLTLPYLARVLGPEAYGVRSYILSMMLFVQTISDYGFNLYGGKRIVKAREDARECSRTMGEIVGAKLLILAVLAVAVACITFTIPLISNKPECVVFGFISVAFNTLMPDFIFIGFEKMGVITSRYVISKSVVTVLVFICVKTSDDLALAFVVEAVGSIVAFGITWRSAIGEIGCSVPVPRIRGVVSSIIGATPFFLSNVSVAAFNSLATMAIGLCLNDAREVAYWSIAITALNAILSLYNPIANALYPHMVHSQDFRLFNRLILVGSILAALGALLFACCSNLIMAVLGGAEYQAGSYILIQLAPVLVFAYPALMLGGPILGAFGKEKELALSSAIPALVYFAALFVFGFFGKLTLTTAALCRVGAEFALFFARIMYANKSIGTIWKKGSEKQCSASDAGEM